MLRWSDWASLQSRKDSGDKVHTHAAPGSITLPIAKLPELLRRS
jgi:hypothetical protein